MPNRASNFKVTTTIDANQNTTITSLTSRVTTLETAGTGGGASTADITALQNRATAIESTNTSQGTSITTLQNRATSIESTNTTQNTNITGLTSRVASLESFSSSSTSSFLASTQYWVDKNGSDSAGNGSLDRPFLTIAKALTVGIALAVSFKVNVGVGTFTEDLSITLSSPLLIELCGCNTTSANTSFIDIPQQLTYINGTLTITISGTTTTSNTQIKLSNLAVKRVRDVTNTATALRTIILDGVYMSNATSPTTGSEVSLVSINALPSRTTSSGGACNLIVRNCNFVDSLASSSNYNIMELRGATALYARHCKFYDVGGAVAHIETFNTTSIDIRYCDFVTGSTTPRTGPFVSVSNASTPSNPNYFTHCKLYARYTSNISGQTLAYSVAATTPSAQSYVFHNLSDVETTGTASGFFLANNSSTGVIYYSNNITRYTTGITNGGAGTMTALFAI